MRVQMPTAGSWCAWRGWPVFGNSTTECFAAEFDGHTSFVEHARLECSQNCAEWGFAASWIGLASSPSPVSASHCTPKRGKSSRMTSKISYSSDVIAKKIVELRRFQS